MTQPGPPDTPKIITRFPPAGGEVLLDSPWRAHMAFSMPPKVTPHVTIQDTLLEALDGRLPVPLLVRDHLVLDFSVEDDAWPSRYLLAEVGRFVLSLVAQSTIVVAEIAYYDLLDTPNPEDPGSGPRSGLRIVH